MKITVGGTRVRPGKKQELRIDQRRGGTRVSGNDFTEVDEEEVIA